MDGCGCDDYATPIDAGIARSDRDSYHANGPDVTTRMLLDMIEANSESGATVLDVGGGIGVIDLELDIVTLDRVVCCYPDADRLVSTSVAHAKRLYGLVLPRDRWYVRWGIKLDNLRWWLRRREYRAYAHANARIDEHVRASGLVTRSEAFTRVWRVVLYARDETEPLCPS